MKRCAELSSRVDALLVRSVLALCLLLIKVIIYGLQLLQVEVLEEALVRVSIGL